MCVFIYILDIIKFVLNYTAVTLTVIIGPKLTKTKVKMFLISFARKNLGQASVYERDPITYRCRFNSLHQLRRTTSKNKQCM